MARRRYTPRRTPEASSTSKLRVPQKWSARWVRRFETLDGGMAHDDAVTAAREMWARASAGRPRKRKG